MKAIAIVPGTTSVHLVDRKEPHITEPDEIKLEILRVGICGTDREEVSGGRSAPPDGQKELVIGHEMFGRVVETGAAVRQVKHGDYAIFTVRRSCGKCLPCLMNRPDMCATGEYRERGIWKLDGYQTEFVVDREQYIVQVPEQVAGIGVLAEPLSVAEKAIDEAVQLQARRLPDAASTSQWLRGKRCLVAGLGPIGLLAALVLRLRHAHVYGLDIVDENSVRPLWLAGIGGSYVDGRRVAMDKIDDQLGPMDLIFEATGVAKLEFNLLDALGLNGIYVLTGIPGGSRPLNIPGAELIRRLVLQNQVILGSVNASRSHFQMAVDDLSHAQAIWKDQVAALITQKYRFTDFAGALEHHSQDEVKVVLEWAS